MVAPPVAVELPKTRDWGCLATTFVLIAVAVGMFGGLTYLMFQIGRAVWS